MKTYIVNAYEDSEGVKIHLVHDKLFEAQSLQAAMRAVRTYLRGFGDVVHWVSVEIKEA